MLQFGNAVFSSAMPVPASVIYSGRKISLRLVRPLRCTRPASVILVPAKDSFSNFDSQPIPGYALADCHLLYGDTLAGVIHWQGGADISSLAGQPIRVRFELKDADLHSLQFTNRMN